MSQLTLKSDGSLGATRSQLRARTAYPGLRGLGDLVCALAIVGGLAWPYVVWRLSGDNKLSLAIAGSWGFCVFLVSLVLRALIHLAIDIADALLEGVERRDRESWEQAKGRAPGDRLPVHN